MTLRKAVLNVFKFGGTSVGSPAAIRAAASRVSASSSSLVVVVSAMSQVTDLLLRAVGLSAAGDASAASVEAHRFGDLHRDLVAQLIVDRTRVDTLLGLIDHATHELVSICESVGVLKELTPRTRDTVVSRGERLLSRIFVSLLEEGGTDAAYVDGQKVIFTERRLGSLWPDFDRSRTAAESEIAPLLDDGKVVVIPGYIAAGPDGEIVTLGRGGSDFSAAIIARCTNAASVTLWKEVDGLMTADPKAVPDARVIPELHYREAGELAYYGAKILHPRTLMPLADRGIRLNVRNAGDSLHNGTIISGDSVSDSFPVKALTAIHDQALVAIEGGGMMGVPGVAGRAFAALARGGHSVAMISQASSESSICFVLPAAQANDAVHLLREEFVLELKTRLLDTVKADKGVALVAVVGLGMRGTPGIAARVFTALSRASINVISIAQGSSELNITVAIREDQTGEALRSLHHEFQLQKVRPLPHRNPRDATLTLFGFGKIGRALARQLVSQEPYLRDDLGVTIRCVALSDRSGLLLDEHGFTSSTLNDLLNAKEGGEELVRSGTGRSPHAPEAVARATAELVEKVWSLPASRSILVDMTAEETAPLLMEAIRHRCDVVLANKKPLAVSQEQFDAMLDAARSAGVSLRYEATVGAGLPVLDTLAKLKAAGDVVEMILGCFSGTLGYLVTQIEDGKRFSEAVRQAWALGYTEPDPRDDLSGMDVARKALILARTLGMRLEMSELTVEPLFLASLSSDDPEQFITNLGELDEEFRLRSEKARAEKKVLRYVARIETGTIRIGLEALPEESPMGRLRGSDNQIVLHSRRYKTNPLVVTGPGAGAEVTAAGVLNDIVAIVTGLGR